MVFVGAGGDGDSVYGEGQEEGLLLLATVFLLCFDVVSWTTGMASLACKIPDAAISRGSLETRPHLDTLFISRSLKQKPHWYSFCL